MRKKKELLLGVIMAAILVIGVLIWWFSQTGQEPSTRVGEGAPRSESTGPIKDLKTIDVKLGEGAAVKHGDMVTVHYTGWLYDSQKPDNKGNKFDSSHDRSEPFKFRVGVGQVIPGWDKGIQGMKAGGQRILMIPADLGYGTNGAGAAIPPNATLMFEVELLKIQ